MTDTTVTTEAPLPNDTAARSPTGEILDRTADQPKDPSLITTPTKTETLEPTKTSDSTKPPEKITSEPDPKAVPDKYEFKAAEGIVIDPKLVEDITPMFKEMGLNQENAQKLFDFHAKAMLEAAKAPTNTVDTMRADWRTKVLADPEMSKAVNGDKVGIEAVKLDIGRAMTHLPPTEATALKAAMDLTGAGDNPDIVKGWWKMSQLITEGKHVTGGGPSPLGQKAPGAPERPSGAKSLFPNLP